MSAVVLVDESEVSIDGTYPFSEELQMRRCYYKFDEWFPPCFACCNIIELYYPNSKSDGQEACHLHCAPFAVPKESKRASEKMKICESGQPCMDDLPNEVLQNIFGYVQPVELTHSVSLVSRRWNRVCQAPTLWHEVRIVMCKKVQCRNLQQTFLHQYGTYIRKICICGFYTSRRRDAYLTELFPPCMPSVTTLDIGSSFRLTISNARFLISCFPNLQRLNGERLKQVEDGALTVLLSEGFPRLTELVLSFCELSDDDTNALCGTVCSPSRALKVLGLDGIWNMPLDTTVRLGASKTAATLTRLYLDGERMYNGAFQALTCCQNLKRLSVSLSKHPTDLALRYIKTLPKLEHLHLRSGPEFTSEGFVKFFQFEPAADGSSVSFPTTLKYLELGRCQGVDDAVVESLTTSCPDLSSLCLAFCSSVTNVGFAKIIQRLKHLVLLDIRGLKHIDGKVLLDVPKLYCKDLRYLRADECRHIEPLTLETLNLQKKDLIVTHSNGLYITFHLKGREAEFGERTFSGSRFQQVVRDELSRFAGYCCVSDYGVSA